MTLNNAIIYGRRLTDFLLPDQIQIIERWCNEEIEEAEKKAFKAGFYFGSETEAFDAPVDIDKSFINWKEMMK